MTHSSQQKIESALAAMEAVLERAQGGRTDDEALLDFRCRCWELMLVVDDGSCQAHIDALVQHARRFIPTASATEPRRCARSSVRSSPNSG